MADFFLFSFLFFFFFCSREKNEAKKKNPQTNKKIKTLNNTELILFVWIYFCYDSCTLLFPDCQMNACVKLHISQQREKNSFVHSGSQLTTTTK